VSSILERPSPFLRCIRRTEYVKLRVRTVRSSQANRAGAVKEIYEALGLGEESLAVGWCLGRRVVEVIAILSVEVCVERQVVVPSYYDLDFVGGAGQPFDLFL
jgi:hypothetical protein